MSKHLGTFSLAIIGLIAALGVVAYSLSQYTFYFTNSATLTSTPEAEIKIFINEGCTSELVNGTSIEWGSVSLGSNTKTYWIKNTGDCDVCLFLTTSTLPSGWSLSWNYVGTEVTPGEVRQVTLILMVPTDASAGTYYWDSWITAEEA